MTLGEDNKRDVLTPFGCYPGVSRLQSADVSLCLPGTEEPPRSVLTGPYYGNGLDVYLQGVTDSMLAALLPAMADNLTGLVITGEQRQLYRLTMYIQGPAVAMVQNRVRHILVPCSCFRINC